MKKKRTAILVPAVVRPKTYTATVPPADQIAVRPTNDSLPASDSVITSAGTAPCEDKPSSLLLELSEESKKVKRAEVVETSAEPPLFSRRLDKDGILETYESQHQVNKKSITAKKGERTTSFRHQFPSIARLLKRCKMKPSLNHRYRVDTLGLQDVAVSLTKWAFSKSKDEHGVVTEVVDQELLSCMKCISSKYNLMVKEVIRLRNVDFTPLLEPRFNYQEQTEIQQDRVDMATALMIRLDMHPGLAVRYVQGEFTGEERDVETVCNTIEPLVSKEDLEHIRRIMTMGCPAKCIFEEDAANKEKMLARGNQKSFEDNPDVADKTLNKEDRYSHLLTTAPWVPYFSPYARHTSQGMVIKEGKNPRVVWDGSTKREALDIVLNEVTTTELEAAITFGFVKRELCSRIYNLRITYPESDILLAMADIKACFRYPRVHVDLTGCFGFLARDLYFLATSMVFGSNTSATSWEPCRRAIELLAGALYEADGLVERHKEYLDMLNWDLHWPAGTKIVKAASCKYNPGVRDPETGSIKPPSPHIYVDDALLGAVGKISMERALAATIEAIFIVMGRPETHVRQCPLAMDKWEGMTVAPKQVMLGLLIDTRRMILGITPDYQDECLQIILQWKGETQFTVTGMQLLIGKLARTGEGAPWVYKLMSHLYHSTAYAIGSNKEILAATSAEFQALYDKIKTKRFTGKPSEVAKLLNFALKKAAQMTNRYAHKYPIVDTMRHELDYFEEALRPDSGIAFETAIAHLVKREPNYKMYGDSSLRACGGYSIDLGFWWHLQFKDEILKRTLLHLKDGNDPNFISINALEYVTVILNYCAALVALETDSSHDPNPIILSITDNRSALNWTLHTSKKSKIGRALARFFCGLLIDSPLGINSEWIATDENEVADQISRLKKAKVSKSNPHPDFDYSSLQQKFPELKACRFFQPSAELTSLLWELLLTERLPQPRHARQLKQNGLGRLITSSSAQGMKYLTLAVTSLGTNESYPTSSRS